MSPGPSGDTSPSPPRAEPDPRSGPPDVPISPALLLIMLGRGARRDIDNALETHGLSLRHFSALGHLSHQPGLSYSELGRRAGVTAQSMLATLRQLEDLGAVERITLPGRGRTAELHITPQRQEAPGHRTSRPARHRPQTPLGATRRSTRRPRRTAPAPHDPEAHPHCAGLTRQVGQPVFGFTDS